MLRPRDKSGYLSVDTIAALATEVGGAIAIIRVSGPEALSLLDQLTRSLISSTAPPRHLVRTPLFGPQGEILDHALIVKFLKPHSYTGEDSVEYQIHGGTFIAHRLIETLIHFGARQALPGEFSFRAVRNGKMTLFQAQAVIDLISASNDGAVSLALEKLSGVQNPLFDKLANDLRRIAALGEVGIDFADQDIEEVTLPQLKKQLGTSLEILERFQAGYRRGELLQEGIRVAFIGLPNVGKSSFFNSLLGKDRSIVSDLAGTTRDVVSEKLTLRGKKTQVTLRLEDTAGLRITDHPIEKIGIERTIRSTQNADLILFLLDSTSAVDAACEQWLALNQTLSLTQRTLGVLTKCDKLSLPEVTAKTEAAIQAFPISNWIPTSSATGAGISDAADKIVEICEHSTHRGPGEVLLTRVEHLTCVTLALEHLRRAVQVSEIELFASDIRQVLHVLSPLIGETLSDDVLNSIFSDFCIGK